MLSPKTGFYAILMINCVRSYFVTVDIYLPKVTTQPRIAKAWFSHNVRGRSPAAPPAAPAPPKFCIRELNRVVQFSISEQLLSRNVERLRGGLVFKAHRSLYHSTLGSRVIKKKKKALACNEASCSYTPRASP